VGTTASIPATAVAIFTAAALTATTPTARADVSQVLVRTQSGNTRCIILTGEVGCETYVPTGFVQGTNFPDAFGNHNANIARVASAGQFEWRFGDIPGEHPENDIVLNYGQTYHFSGWTVSPTTEGTRFANDGTGHGMFVSIENVSSF